MKEANSEQMFKNEEITTTHSVKVKKKIQTLIPNKDEILTH